MLLIFTIINTVLLVLILLVLFGIFEQNKAKDFSEFMKERQKAADEFEEKRKSHHWGK